MIALYLLAAHLVGDFLLQNRWMARKKLDDAGWRAYHVAVYCVPFVPIAAVYAHRLAYNRLGSALLFLLLLAGLHYATDSRRFRSTVGDWVHWHFVMRPEQQRKEWRYVENKRIANGDPPLVGAPRSLPPNIGWPLVSSAVDQTLHLVQLVVLGSVFLT